MNEIMSKEARREKALELLREAARVLENAHPSDDAVAHRAAWRAADVIHLLWPELDPLERSTVLEHLPNPD